MLELEGENTPFLKREYVEEMEDLDTEDFGRDSSGSIVAELGKYKMLGEGRFFQFCWCIQ